ncbi:MAG TPA: Rpn family recombination-promoting nuclease/putative transposase [Candidatus Mediterraneibacter caccogallinarum]|nr:Rpn family recombination-promoting nuclease/putative transposase [Candidatus Mediterraneibacter caccogallinarum]
MSTQKSRRNSDNFIMLPTVDFCFKELMQNPKVRKGFIAAILEKSPGTIRRTTLIPTALQKESEEDKLGILDVLVELEDGTKMNMEMQVSYFDCWTNRVLFYLGKIYTGQIKEGEDYDRLRKCIHVSILDFVHFPQDEKCCRKIVFCDAESGEQYTDLMELHILELKKLPPKDQSEDGIIRWMRFLGGKNRKEFEDMAKKDEYIEEAYNELKKLSLDEEKRLEYELRQKAVRDHNMMMKSAEKRGLEIGRKQGEQLALKRVVEKQLKAGKTVEETAELLGMDIQEVRELTEE